MCINGQILSLTNFYFFPTQALYYFLHLRADLIADWFCDQTKVLHLPVWKHSVFFQTWPYVHIKWVLQPYLLADLDVLWRPKQTSDAGDEPSAPNPIRCCHNQPFSLQIRLNDLIPQLVRLLHLHFISQPQPELGDNLCVICASSLSLEVDLSTRVAI